MTADLARILAGPAVGEITDIMAQMAASGRGAVALSRWLVEEYVGKMGGCGGPGGSRNARQLPPAPKEFTP
jgi:hypothetical protein